MSNPEASEAANDALFRFYGGRVPQLDGWIFYAARNGIPLAEAPHGKARRTAAQGYPDLTFGADSIVHLASIAKLICAVGILRFIEDWNEIASDTHDNRGPSVYTGAPRPGDEALIKSVEYWGGPLSLDSPIFPLLKRYLKWQGLFPIGEIRPAVTGLGVDTITIKELLTHTSGLRDGYYNNGLALLNLERDAIKKEVTQSGKVKFDLVQDCAVIFASDIVAKVGSYCNDGFTPLGALIQLSSETGYEDWLKRKIFPDPRFDDIARRPVDMARAARYYGLKGDGNNTGVFHPDYRDFSACGGYYASARALCDWLDAVMQKEAFSGRPILNDPQPLLDFYLGCDGFSCGPLRGLAKNGGASVGMWLPSIADPVLPGSANSRIAYIKGYGNDRVTAFIHVNESVEKVTRQNAWGNHTKSGDPLLEDGLFAIRKFIYRTTVQPVAMPEIIPHQGLQGKRWRSPASGGDAVAMRFVPAVQNGVTISGDVADRTNLLAGAPAGFNTGDVQVVEVSGILTPPAGAYKLWLSSDDGAMLYIDDKLVADNGIDHPLMTVESKAITFPATGLKFRLHWYNGGGGAGLYLEWIRMSDNARQAVPANCFRTRAAMLQPPTP